MLARRSLVALLLLLLAGCVPLQFLDPSLGNGETATVPTSPFGNSAQLEQTSLKPEYTPSSSKMALYVDHVLQNILAANPNLGVRPVVGTIGKPHAEIFHRGPQIIYVTEGLIKQCKNDGEIAALLCLELGKMVSENEARRGPHDRPAPGMPPINVPIGNAGQFNAPDPVALAEVARYEAQRKEATKSRLPPDPQVLAASYLEKSGYTRDKLSEIGPLLEAADRNYILEKQMKGQILAPSWTPVVSGQ